MAEQRDGDRMGSREWRVAGGLLVAGVDCSPAGDGPSRILLVANRRRGGLVEWTPPGGVVDPDETMVDALTREVVEETGLRVDGWTGPCYRVRVDFPDREMTLVVEIHRATGWSGAMAFSDPDGIVEDARFVDVVEAVDLTATAPLWVREPFGAWLSDLGRGDGGGGVRDHEFVARGTRAGELVVERV